MQIIICVYTHMKLKFILALVPMWWKCGLCCTNKTVIYMPFLQLYVNRRLSNYPAISFTTKTIPLALNNLNDLTTWIKWLLNCQIATLQYPELCNCAIKDFSKRFWVGGIVWIFIYKAPPFHSLAKFLLHSSLWLLWSFIQSSRSLL